jgi:hypothetical protein
MVLLERYFKGLSESVSHSKIEFAAFELWLFECRSISGWRRQQKHTEIGKHLATV